MGVQLWALVDLYRIREVMGGRKWLWAVVIIFLSNLALGAILYIAIGRRVPQEVEQPAQTPLATGDRAQRAVDSLYGPSDGGSAQ